MSLLLVSCAMALQVGDSCPAPAATAASFAAVAVSEQELATIYGQGLPQVGLDQAGPAAGTRFVAVAFADNRQSEEIRDVVDNWNVQVAAPLIAQAIADQRR